MRDRKAICESYNTVHYRCCLLTKSQWKPCLMCMPRSSARPAADRMCRLSTSGWTINADVPGGDWQLGWWDENVHSTRMEESQGVYARPLKSDSPIAGPRTTEPVGVCAACQKVSPFPFPTYLARFFSHSPMQLQRGRSQLPKKQRPVKIAGRFQVSLCVQASSQTHAADRMR